MNVHRILLLALFAYIPSSASIVGAAYFWLTNLHTDTIVYETQAVLVPTVVIPAVILLLGAKKGTSKSISGLLVTIGIWAWFSGSLLSSLAHASTEGVWLTFITGIGSALMVYCASLTIGGDLKLTEQLMCCVMVSGLIPGVFGLIAYYQSWGIPSAATLLYSRYDLLRMKPYMDATFGNTGGAACFFSILAAVCIPILVFTPFHWLVRVLAAATLCVSLLNLIITQARTSYFAFALTLILVLAFRRSLVLTTIAIVGCFAIVLLTPSDIRRTLWDSLHNAASYSVADNSAIERIQSVEIGWQQFRDNPIAGVGPGQSNRDNPFFTAHHLAVSQASEIGFLGFIGVLSVTIGVLTRTAELMTTQVRDLSTKMALALLIAPCVYFSCGMVATVFVNVTFHNTWICLVMGLVGASESWFGPVVDNPGAAIPVAETLIA